MGRVVNISTFYTYIYKYVCVCADGFVNSKTFFCKYRLCFGFYVFAYVLPIFEDLI